MVEDIYSALSADWDGEANTRSGLKNGRGSFDHTRRLGNSTHYRDFMGPHLCLKFMRTQVEMLGAFGRRSINMLRHWEFDNCRLPVSS
jgi:hypothetical protein